MSQPTTLAAVKCSTATPEESKMCETNYGKGFCCMTIKALYRESDVTP